MTACFSHPRSNQSVDSSKGRGSEFFLKLHNGDLYGLHNGKLLKQDVFFYLKQTVVNIHSLYLCSKKCIKPLNKNSKLYITCALLKVQFGAMRRTKVQSRIVCCK